MAFECDPDTLEMGNGTHLSIIAMELEGKTGQGRDESSKVCVTGPQAVGQPWLATETKEENVLLAERGCLGLPFFIRVTFYHWQSKGSNLQMLYS